VTSPCKISRAMASDKACSKCGKTGHRPHDCHEKRTVSNSQQQEERQAEAGETSVARQATSCATALREKPQAAKIAGIPTIPRVTAPRATNLPGFLVCICSLGRTTLCACHLLFALATLRPCHLLSLPLLFHPHRPQRSRTRRLRRKIQG
jgi:hypothetical protein